MTSREDPPENAENLIGIRTRRGTLLQGAIGAAEENPEARAEEQRFAPPLEQNAGESHRELPPPRDPSGGAGGDEHETATLTLSAPENQVRTGGNVLREALASSARSLEQMAGLTPNRNQRTSSLQVNRLPRAAEQLEEQENEVPPTPGRRSS